METNDDVTSIIDGNAVLQSPVAVPDTFEEVAKMVFGHLPKCGRDFVTDTYHETAVISSPSFLLSGTTTKTPREWKSLRSHNFNKTQHLKLLLEQWSTDKYAEQL
ncbi:hypothetical protein DPMN_154457 [Dreissena polymorpha]|uniref:Uncharacterized protein n=1 Tax=Dreissena polymorpha TaxID=45954 RepID=A0A9D4FKH1_DREPO|nr:hypothetical protein DPMN_154457 [Dreissena polymorpha]